MATVSQILFVATNFYEKENSCRLRIVSLAVLLLRRAGKTETHFAINDSVAVKLKPRTKKRHKFEAKKRRLVRASSGDPLSLGNNYESSSTCECPRGAATTDFRCKLSLLGNVNSKKKFFISPAATFMH